MENSRNEIKRESSIAKREKITKIHKIKIIYASKLKSNVTRQKITKKTNNLTQNDAWNDPINHQIKDFYSIFRKTKIQSSSNKFFLLSRWNLDFKHSVNVKMSLEEEENKIFKYYAIQKFWSIKNQRMLYTV